MSQNYSEAGRKTGSTISNIGSIIADKSRKIKANAQAFGSGLKEGFTKRTPEEIRKDNAKILENISKIDPKVVTKMTPKEEVKPVVEAQTVEIPKVGVVKYGIDDLKKISYHLSKGLALNRFQVLVLQAVLHKQMN